MREVDCVREWLEEHIGERAIVAHFVDCRLDILEGTLDQLWPVEKQECFGFSACFHTWTGFHSFEVRPEGPGGRSVVFSLGLGRGDVATFALKLPDVGSWMELSILTRALRKKPIGSDLADLRRHMAEAIRKYEEGQ